jgi:hypothetical protein
MSLERRNWFMIFRNWSSNDYLVSLKTIFINQFLIIHTVDLNRA